jgi:L-threonylcarbamoyladenylate synthase
MNVTVEQAAAILKRGGIVAIPTETVYGLAADACNEEAVLRVFAAKNRPPSNPLICHVPDAQAVERYAASVPPWVRRFWPGPLTVLLKHRGNLAPSVTAGSDFCAFRVPDHVLALELLRLVTTPLCAPSANTSGRVSPVNALMVQNDLGSRIDGILDGGQCSVGVESTIVEPAGDNAAYILRTGGVTREDLEQAGVTILAGGSQKAPGQSPAHYAPRIPLLLLALPPGEGARARSIAFDPERTLVLSFGESTGLGCREWNLAPNGNLEEAARRLFDSFDRASALDIDLIVAADPPKKGMGAAIHDRLWRAATYVGFVERGTLRALEREGSFV